MIFARLSMRRSVLDETVQFLIRHSYALLFGWVLVEQMGLPIPAAEAARSSGYGRGDGEHSVRRDRER